MIDYTAAGFTLLQGAHSYAPEDREFAMSSSLTAKLSPLPAMSLLTLYQHGCRSQWAGSSAGVLLINVHLLRLAVAAGLGSRRARRVALSRPDRQASTSVVGLLGTDSISHHPESLLAKTRALNEEGISAWMLTSAYHVPSRTITGSVEKDIGDYRSCDWREMRHL